MQRMVRILGTFQLVCFAVFVIAAVLVLFSGFALIAREKPDAAEGSDFVMRMFMASVLLMITAGLVVSGARAMIAGVKDSESGGSPRG